MNYDVIISGGGLLGLITAIGLSNDSVVFIRRSLI